MTEPLSEYFMYFPAVPISDLSDPAGYAAVPRRRHAYLGETVHFLLVLRFRDGCRPGGASPWWHRAGSLSALASVCAAESRRQRRHGAGQPPDLRSSSRSSEDDEGEDPGEREPGSTDSDRTFTECNALLVHRNPAPDGKQPVESPLVLDDQVIFRLAVSLDKLPVDTLKAKITVTLWTQEEKVEVTEHGYLTLLQFRSPTHTFRRDQSAFKAQVDATLSVLPPPSVQCRQMTVSGKHLTVLKVVNCSSQEEVCLRDMKILPNYNSSYLPMMPDGSVLVVDNVCHQSAEVTTASFCRINSESSRLPTTLGALEQQSLLFQLQLQDRTGEESSEGMEIPLVAVLQWYTPALPLTRYISSFYSLPSIRLDRPQLVMTASCPRAVRPLEHFWVKYTLLNNLQDFAVRLIWNSEARGHQQDPEEEADAVVCQSPVSDLGRCSKGSTLSFTVAFQILRAGLFELSQHVKLNLQLTATVSTPPPPPPPPPPTPPSSQPKESPSSASSAAGELPETRVLGRSRSFSHQQSSRSHHVRSGSAMEHRAVAPPPSPGGAARPAPPRHTLIPAGKIAKRQCKVLVLERVQEAHCR